LCPVKRRNPLADLQKRGISDHVDDPIPHAKFGYNLQQPSLSGHLSTDKTFTD